METLRCPHHHNATGFNRRRCQRPWFLRFYGSKVQDRPRVTYKLSSLRVGQHFQMSGISIRRVRIARNCKRGDGHHRGEESEDQHTGYARIFFNKLHHRLRNGCLRGFATLTMPLIVFGRDHKAHLSFLSTVEEEGTFYIYVDLSI